MKPCCQNNEVIMVRYLGVTRQLMNGIITAPKELVVQLLEILQNK